MIAVNTLVRHPKHEGIGCVAKVLSKHVEVNFGLSDVFKVSPGSLMEIDTSACKTVSIQDCRSRIMMVKESDLNDVIVGNELKHFVGIGWTTTRVITDEDLKRYPRVIHS